LSEKLINSKRQDGSLRGERVSAMWHATLAHFIGDHSCYKTDFGNKNHKMF